MKHKPIYIIGDGEYSDQDIDGYTTSKAKAEKLVHDMNLVCGYSFWYEKHNYINSNKYSKDAKREAEFNKEYPDSDTHINWPPFD